MHEGTILMFYVYILRSKLDNKLYTGFSSNLKKRIAEHSSGEVESTKNRRPLELIYYEAYQEKENALKREKFLTFLPDDGNHGFLSAAIAIPGSRDVVIELEV